MKLFVVDAFTAKKFSGNQAGVALLELGEDFPEEGFMRALAGELKHSETVFVKRLGSERFHCRYFTPVEEVDLCGHATIAAFTALREEGLGVGDYAVTTKAGELSIEVSPRAVWMDMAAPTVARGFSAEETGELYAAYGLSALDMPNNIRPMAVSAGLTDILLPVNSREALDRAEQDEGAVIELSRRYGVVGVHMFWPCLTGETTAHCRNFAPLYAIPEEAATGTSNGALTYYLHTLGCLVPERENRFIQGERMGKPSEILSRLTAGADGVKVRVGGQAVVSLELCLWKS